MRQQFKRLANSTLVYGTGQILTSLISFLLLPLFTSYLTTTDYGITAILGLLNFVANPIFSLGLGVSIGPCYFESDSRECRETTLWSAIVTLGISAATLCVLALAFAPQISLLAFQTSGYAYFVKLSLLTTALIVVHLPLRLYLQFNERAKLFVTLTTTSTLIMIGSNILMIVGLRRGVQGWVEGQLLGQAATLILFLGPVLREMRFRFSLTSVRELLRLGLPLTPTFIFLFLLLQGNKYMLQWFRGLGEVGVYNIGFNLGFFMGVPVSAFQSAWYPFFMSFINKREEAGNLFGRVLTYYVLGLGTLNLLLFVSARPVVMIMTQPPFHEAYKVVGFSASAQFMSGIFSVLMPGIYFAKEIKYLTVVQAVAAIAALGLNFLLIPQFGMLGAAVVLLLGNLTMVVLEGLWIRHKKYLAIRYQWGRVARFGLVYVVFVIGMTWERKLALPYEIGLAAIVTLLLAFLLYHQLDRHEQSTLCEMIKQISKQPYSQVAAIRNATRHS